MAINARSEYSSTLLRKRSPRRRWPQRVGRFHKTQCRGQGTRPATRNHPRTYNTHATGNHPSSLSVGWARLASRLRLTISLRLPSPGESPLSALSGLFATSPSGGGGDWGRPAGPGQSARPGSGLAAPSSSHRATGSPRKQAAGLTATGSLGAVGGAARFAATPAGKVSRHGKRPYS